MGKKSSKLNLLYVIGMALVIVGSFLPIITISLGFLGKIDITLFKAFQNLKSLDSWMALIMVVAAAIGVIFSFIGGKKKGMILLVALIASIVCGLIMFANAGFFKSWFKITGIGFYVIVAGWIVAAVGEVMKK